MDLSGRDLAVISVGAVAVVAFRWARHALAPVTDNGIVPSQADYGKYDRNYNGDDKALYPI